MFSKCCLKLKNNNKINNDTSINGNLIQDLVYDLNLRNYDENKFNNILNKLVCFTNSEFGYILRYNSETGELDELAVTNISWDYTSTQQYINCITKKSNLFTNKCSAYFDSIKYKAPMIYNKFEEIRKCSYSADHPPIHSFMSIPILDDDFNTIGSIGFANRHNGYTEDIILSLQPIIDYLKKIFMETDRKQ
jgi:hypothetical protein